MPNTVQSLVSGRRARGAGRAVFLALPLLLGCGGQSQDAANGGAGHSGANSAGSSSSSGAGSGSIAFAFGGVGGVGWLSLGGASSAAGAAGASNACDEGVLWEAITDAAVSRLGYCVPASIPGPDERVGGSRGAVVIDADGRLIDNTGLSGGEKRVWLAGLSDRRWTCLAGQSIGFECSIAD